MYFPKRLIVAAFVLTFSQAVLAEVSVDVKLSPAGSFKAETKKVSGTAHKTADGVIAENVIIEASTLATGISLRDSHLKKRLLTEKFPKIRLVKAVGRNGQGKGVMEIMGRKKEIAGTYKVEGNNLSAQFKMSLADLDIKDVSYMAVGVKDEVVINIKLPLSSETSMSSHASTKKKKARK